MINENYLPTRRNENAFPAISVVLPVYNGEKYLSKAIDSILAQTFSDFEMIIIDDGSTDGSLRLLREYQKRDARIRLISRENRNLATTLNESIDIAHGEWVARMDQDDIALPQRFERQLRWLEKTGADITGSWAKHFGSWDRRICRRYQSDDAIKMDMLFKSPFVHPTVMMRTKLVKQERYDKRFEGAEDYDLWVRAAQAGWKMSNVPEVLLLYRMHASQITTQSSNRQKNLGEEIRRRYWTFVTDLMRLRPEGALEIFNLGQSNAKPNIDVVDETLNDLLLHNQREARAAIMDNISRLYLRVCADDPNVAARWCKLNQRFGPNVAPRLLMFKFWIVRLLRIRYGSNSFNRLKKVHSFLIR
jgi:glycosyltransferase involved in cell wall biosynthesis